MGDVAYPAGHFAVADSEFDGPEEPEEEACPSDGCFGVQRQGLRVHGPDREACRRTRARVPLAREGLGPERVDR